jgi:hypothetical protein
METLYLCIRGSYLSQERLDGSKTLHCNLGEDHTMTPLNTYHKELMQDIEDADWLDTDEDDSVTLDKDLHCIKDSYAGLALQYADS